MAPITRNKTARRPGHSLRLGVFALLTAAILAPGRAAAQTETRKQRPAAPAPMAKYPIGTAVDVHLRNKETITGRVEKYADDGIWIQAEGKDSRKHREIFYFEMESVKAARGAAEGKARFSLDFLAGGSGASVRVYTPKHDQKSH